MTLDDACLYDAQYHSIVFVTQRRYVYMETIYRSLTDRCLISLMVAVLFSRYLWGLCDGIPSFHWFPRLFRWLAGAWVESPEDRPYSPKLSLWLQLPYWTKSRGQFFIWAILDIDPGVFGAGGCFLEYCISTAIHIQGRLNRNWQGSFSWRGQREIQRGIRGLPKAYPYHIKHGCI